MSTHEIPDKLFFRIGEVYESVGIVSSCLRLWESEFPTLDPGKCESGHRIYKRKDVENVLRIKELLYVRGYTIAGARKFLSKSRGSKKADRDQVLTQIRNGLKDILTLLRRKT